jgi:hypothetical protein
MKVSISLKTTLIMQGSIVVSLLPVNILLGLWREYRWWHLSPPEDVMSNYIVFVVTMYSLLWGLTYSDLFENNKNKDSKIK